MDKSRSIHGVQNKNSVIQEDSDESTASIDLEQNVDKLINFNKCPQAKVYRFKYLNRAQDVEIPKLRKSVVTRAYQNFGYCSTPFVSSQKDDFFPEDCSLNLSPITTDNDDKSDKIGRNKVNDKEVIVVTSSEGTAKECVSPERNKCSCKQLTSHKHKRVAESNVNNGNSINISERSNKKNINDSLKDKSCLRRTRSTYLQSEREENKFFDISDNFHSSIRHINSFQDANKRNDPKVNKSARKNNTKIAHTIEENDFCGHTGNTKTEKYKSKTNSGNTRSKINESQDRITKDSLNEVKQISQIQNIDNANFSKTSEAKRSRMLKVINQDITQQHSSSSQVKTIVVHNNRLLKSAKKAFVTNVSKHNASEMNENEVQPTKSCDIPNKLSFGKENFEPHNNRKKLDLLCTSPSSSSRCSDGSRLLDELDQMQVFDGLNNKGGFLTPENEINLTLIQSDNKTETITENSEKIHRLNDIIAQLSVKKSNKSDKGTEVSRTSTDSHSPVTVQNSRILLNKEIQTSVKKSNRNRHLNNISKTVNNSIKSSSVLSNNKGGDEAYSKNKDYGSNLLFASLAEDKSIGFSRDENLYISNNQSPPWRISIDSLPINSLRRSNIQVPFLKKKIEVESVARHDRTLCEPSDRQSPKISLTELKILKQYENKRKTDERENLTSRDEHEEYIDEIDSDDSFLNEPKNKLKPYRNDTSNSKKAIKQFKKKGQMVENKQFKKKLFYNKKRFNKKCESNKVTEKELNEDNVEIIETANFSTRNNRVSGSLNIESTNSEFDAKSSRDNGQLQHSCRTPMERKSITNSKFASSESDEDNINIQKVTDQSVESERESKQNSLSKNIKLIEPLDLNTSVQEERGSDANNINNNESQILEAEVEQNVDSRQLNLQTSGHNRKTYNNINKDKGKSRNHSVNNNQNVTFKGDETGNTQASDYTSNIEIPSKFCKNDSQAVKSVCENISKVVSSANVSTNNLVSTKESTSRKSKSRQTLMGNANVEIDAQISNECINTDLETYPMPISAQNEHIIGEGYNCQSLRMQNTTNSETDGVNHSLNSKKATPADTELNLQQVRHSELQVMLLNMPVNITSTAFKVPKKKGESKRKKVVLQSCGEVSSGSEEALGRPKRERRPVSNKYGVGYVVCENDRELKAVTSRKYEPRKKASKNKTLQKTKNSTKETIEPDISNAEKQSKVKDPAKKLTAKKKEKPSPKRLSFTEDSNIQTDELTSQLNTHFNSFLQPEPVRPLQDCSNSLATSHLVGDCPTYNNCISKDSGRSSFREDTFRGTKSPDKVHKSRKKHVRNLSHKLPAVSAKIKANSTANLRVPAESLGVLTEDLEAPMTSVRRSSRLNPEVQESEFINLLTDNNLVNRKYVQNTPKFHLIKENLMVADCLEPVTGTGMAYLRIPPGGKKSLSVSKNYSYFYSVFNGEGQIQVYDRTKKIGNMSMFFVPKGIEYFILNTSNEEPLLLFFVKTNLLD